MLVTRLSFRPASSRTPSVQISAARMQAIGSQTARQRRKRSTIRSDSTSMLTGVNVVRSRPTYSM